MKKLNNYKDPKIFNNKYIIKNEISSGSFGIVFLAYDKHTKEEVAIKLEKYDGSNDLITLDRETEILTLLKGTEGIPQLYWSGFEQEYNTMVLSLHGKDLGYQMKQNKRFCLKSVIQIGIQLVETLRRVHTKGVVHRDLKPENILVGLNDPHNVYLVDFGVSKIYIEKNKHIPFRDKKSFIGTTRYASIAAHKGYEIGRKDDLESLFYVLIYFYKWKLPWQNLQNIGETDRTFAVGELKINTKIVDLCKDMPNEFCEILYAIRGLDFYATPNYDMIINKLRDICKAKQYTINNIFEWNTKSQSSPKSISNKEKQIVDMMDSQQQKLLQIPNRSNLKQNSYVSASQGSSVQIQYGNSRMDLIKPNIDKNILDKNKDVRNSRLKINQKIQNQKNQQKEKKNSLNHKNDEPQKQIQKPHRTFVINDTNIPPDDTQNQKMTLNCSTPSQWDIMISNYSEFNEECPGLDIRLKEFNQYKFKQINRHKSPL